MKKFFIALMIIFIFSSCSKSPYLESEKSNIDIAEPTESVEESKIEQTENSITLPNIPKSGPEQYTVTHRIDEMINQIKIEEYDSGIDNTEMLETLSWFRSYPNREQIIEAAKEIDAEIQIDGEYSSFFPAVNNSIPLEDVLTECAIESIVYASDNAISNKQDYSNNPEVWDGLAYPVVFLRQVEPGQYYTVRKLQGGGWLYSFYGPWPHETNVGGVYEYCDDMSHITYNGGVYLEKVLAHSDFSSVTIGTPIEEVEKIDSAVSVYRMAHELNAYPGPWTGYEYYDGHMETRHLLTDGLLTIFYEKSNDNWIVSKINFAEDYMYAQEGYYQWYWDQIDYDGITYYKQFKILPQDFPPAS